MLQAQELTLALRRVSDKLELTESFLLERTKELVAERSEKERLKMEAELANAIVSSLRVDLDRLRANQRQMEKRIKAAEEERRMTELAVDEYANLVRSLEEQHSVVPVHGEDKWNHFITRSTAQLDGLAMAKKGLKRLLEEFNAETENLHTEIARLHTALEFAQLQFDAEQNSAEGEKEKLARALVEIERAKVDDNSAAKVVSRYMCEKL